MTESPPVKRTPIGVCLVEPHRLLREGLRLLIERHPALRVVGDGPSPASVVMTADDVLPHVLVVSHDLDGDEILSDLAVKDGRPRWLLLTESQDPAMPIRAIRLGAAGVVTKDQPVHVLHKAIEKVHDGEAWFDRTMVAAIFSEVSRPSMRSVADIGVAAVADLTKRERQVMALAAEGLKNRTVADRLLISEATVRHHLTSIFGKLGVADRSELIIFAHRLGAARLQTEPA